MVHRGVGVGRLLQRVAGADDRAQPARLRELGDPGELVPVGLDDEVGRADAVPGRLAGVGRLGDTDQDAARAHHGCRTQQRLPADRVDDHVDVVHLLLELGRRVVDHLAGAEAGHEVRVRGRAGRRHLRAERHG
jgi:hypothetical protein